MDVRPPAKSGYPVAVVGGGLAGSIAALALGTAGVSSLLFAPSAAADRRTTALLGGSVQALRTLGVWDEVAAKSAPLEKLRIADATARLFRSQEMLFDAAEVDLDAFGYNIENADLLAVLRAALARMPDVRVVEAPVERISPGAASVELHAEGGIRNVRLAIAADGRNSMCRLAAGISTRRRTLPQAALTANLRHSRPHRNISTEFHTEAGPFTLVPLPGDRSSLVWVTEPSEAERLSGIGDAALAREIELRAHSILGAMEIDGARGVFPLAMETAERLAASRVALIGDAGHLLPPIGAQGLNLGLRDAATIAELAADALRAGGDPGGDDVLRAYEERRRADVRTRALAVDLLNRSLLTDFLPAQFARGIGMGIAARVPPIRRALMRSGLGADEAPNARLLRGEPV